MSRFNKKAFVLITLVCIAVAFGLFAYFTPPAFDDLMFKHRYLDYSGGSTEFSWQWIIDYAKELRSNDNGRLSNILCAPVILMLPHWLFSVIVGLAFVLLYYWVVKMAGVSKQWQATFIILAWGASLILLPFRNHIIVCDFLLNYLFASVFILWFIQLLNRTTSGRLSWPNFIGLIVLSVIAAWFHEGFSASVCIALAAYALKKRLALPLKWWLPVIIFGAVSLWTALSPGLMMRANSAVGERGLRDIIFTLITVLPGASLMAAIFIIALFNRKVKSKVGRILSNPTLFVCTVASIAAAVIILIVNSDPRAGWPAEIFAFPVLLSFLASCTPAAPRRIVRRLGAVVLIAICVFFGNVIRWQRIFYIQNREIVELLDESANGTIFYDIIDPRSARLSTLFMATRDQWVLSFQYYCLSQDVGRPGRQYAVVPAVLENYTPERERRIDGTARLTDFHGVLVGLDGGYINESNGWYSDVGQYNFTTEGGDVYSNHLCLRLRFRMPDGRKYMYVYPYMPIPDRIVSADSVAGNV